ncbi:hypothetical protein [Mycobacterium hackensackense]|uniref:hypothetical protein n=1 Tax=Mycobacterium hackensackense TaxID=228909 RepID=UPI002265E9D8|nr:hypothetical protein [Mycobacterium hackensackense]
MASLFGRNYRRLERGERVVDTGAESDRQGWERTPTCGGGDAAAVVEQRYVIGIGFHGDCATVELAMTLAQSLAYDNGDRSRAVALARMSIHQDLARVSVNFLAGPAPTRMDAVESLRTDLGQAALDLDSRRWCEQAQLLRALSAAAT